MHFDVRAQCSNFTRACRAERNRVHRRIWIYLTRHFGRGEFNFMIATSIAHIHLRMRSAIPRLLSGIEQSQPSHAQGQGLAYFPSNLQLQDAHRMDLHFFDLQALKRASTLYRVQQYPKTARTTSDGASAVKNCWRFQQQEHQLSGLPYDKHLQELLFVLPDYQDQIREDLVMYRKWLLREITDEEVTWVRSAVSQEIFEDALLRQVNNAFRATARSPTPADYSQDFQSSMALRFYQIINPLHEPFMKNTNLSQQHTKASPSCVADKSSLTC